MSCYDCEVLNDCTHHMAPIDELEEEWARLEPDPYGWGDS